jgi:hypothetical protein
MPLTTAFHLSFYVTLGLASACLALAETFFLWWMSFFLVGTLILLWLAYRWEGRWALSADAANRLGMVIAIGTAFWILYNLPHSEEDLMAAEVPWPAGLLPHLGPLLILLLLVKLFRPKRQTDYWVIHTIGLMMVTLGCVLAAEPLFGVLLVLYLASLLWSLALFHMVRETGRHDDKVTRWQVDKVTGSQDDDLFLSPCHLATLSPCPLPWRALGLGRVSSWTAMVVPLGLGMFLIAPRQDNFQWEPKQLTRAAKGILKTGFDGGMDCARVGKIELSEDPAFEVQAMDRRGPKLDLDSETRWSMQTLDFYYQGHWTNWGQGVAPQHLTWGIPHKPEPLALPSVEGRSHPRTPPADLKDPDFYLYFKVRLASAGGLVLAEPLLGTRLGLYPHLGENAVERSFFFYLAGTDSLLAGHHSGRRVCQYGQVLRKLDNPNVVPAKEVNPRYRQFLINQDVPESIVQWVRELLGKAGSAALPDLTEADCQLDGKGRIPPAAHAKVAQALTRYLAFSGDFGYSLYLQRRQMSLDPLADFLLNVKEGHCERYAGGLTLMLRSLGIPARVIKGYRGLDYLDDGHYVVRQNQAHSWVQALITAETGDCWLTLDPTPATERTNKPLLSWFGWLFQGWIENDLWRNYVMDYNADQQGHAFESIRDQMTPEEPRSVLLFVLVCGALVLAAFLALKVRRRWARRTAPNENTAGLAFLGAGFYPRFLEIASRLLNVQPEPGQTPREFGLRAQSCLESRALGEDCSAIPLKLVDLLYRARFGGHTLTSAEERQANRDVETLERTIPRVSC